MGICVIEWLYFLVFSWFDVLYSDTESINLYKLVSKSAGTFKRWFPISNAIIEIYWWSLRGRHADVFRQHPLVSLDSCVISKHLHRHAACNLLPAMCMSSLFVYRFFHCMLVCVLLQLACRSIIIWYSFGASFHFSFRHFFFLQHVPMKSWILKSLLITSHLHSSLRVVSAKNLLVSGMHSLYSVGCCAPLEDARINRQGSLCVG